MDEIIEAFGIFKKYLPGDKCKYAIGCEHDIMYVYVPSEDVSQEDKNRLQQLGFTYKADDEEEPGEVHEHGNFEYFT